MSRKNLLSDTDYTSGKDNRYHNTVHIGRVSEVVCDETQANVRVIMPDKLDHENQPLITKPVPVLHHAATGKRHFQMPRVGTNVVLLKMPNGTASYLVAGSFYTTSDPPPVTDPKLDYTEWEGGHSETRDANDDAEVFLTQDFKGGVKTTVKKDIEIKTTDGGKMSMTSDGDMLVKSATGNVNVESPSGAVNIKQKTINLEADTINLKGHVVVTGAMDQTGVHHDDKGFHTNAAREEELLARVEALERRVAQLEERHGR